MGRPLTVLAAPGVAAVACVGLTASATGAVRAAAPCTVLTAKSGILSSDLSTRVKQDAAGRSGSGIDRVICRDLTGDGRKDMVVSVYAPAVGIEAWVFFRAAADTWKLSFRRTGLVRASIRTENKSVLESEPVYRAGDKRPCCPTGGRNYYRFKWRHAEMVTVRSWHTRR
jgi:hypothetical protein